jgi:hypothetical protein
MTSFPYDPMRKSLYTPGLATDFFQLGRDEKDAALCAEMARLAYVEEESRLVEYLGRAGFRLVGRFDEAGTQVFVAQRAQTVVLAFRGTEGNDPMDLFTDARFLQEPWPGQTGSGRVHTGFKEALGPRWERIARLIPAETKRLLFTGHSLGAALATLAASLRRPDYLATFGSPLVGDAAFGRSLDGVAHDRYVDCCDIVTRVPPDGFGYAHTGILHYIERSGTVRRSPEAAEIESDRRVAFLDYLPTALRKGTVTVRELADHAPINYTSAVMGVRFP